MKIYTKKGDDGTTSLVGGERVHKNDPRVEAYGTVDELTAFIALLRDNIDTEELALNEYREDLEHIQNILMNIESILAALPDDTQKVPSVAQPNIEYLEKRIDYMSGQLEPLTRFTVPGGHPLVSQTHICRTVCRRAERTVQTVADSYPVPQNVAGYLNRLSDYFYLLGRKITQETGSRELYWEPADQK